jgi:uncharacterized membrane protein (UPF0127 family)
MTLRTFTAALAFGFLLLTEARATSDADALDRLFPRSSLQIATSDAHLHRFDIWVADTEQRRERGLMFVKHMAPDAGMLFIYPGSQTISMWMKNTYIPLDMLFVAADGKVVKVVENTKPESLDTINSDGAVRGVIELNAGVAAQLKLRPGSMVIHPAFLPQ